MKIGRLWISNTLVAFIVLVAGVFGALILGLCLIERASCSQTWSRSGMASEYGFFSGCQIEVVPGKWIPAERYREVPP